MGQNAVAADELRLLIERVERIEEEIKAAQDDRKDVYSEAKSRGFCTKTMKTIVALRKLDADDRRNREAMLDLYKGALGMLDGTPLGNWALEKLTKVSKSTPEPDAGAQSGAYVPDVAAPKSAGGGKAGNSGSSGFEEQTPAASAPPLTIEDARRMGGDDARSGKPVTANPFPPRDPRRAAWDEAWCQALGSDGMEIPDALRPAAKKPKAGTTADDVQDGPASEPEAGVETPAPVSATAAGEDPAYSDARAAVLREQYASVSKIQAWLSIGYRRAAAIIAQMEAEGVVSAAKPTGERDVLLDRDGNPKGGQ